MDIKVTVTLNDNAMKVLEEAQRQALEMTADAIKTDLITRQVIPKQIGELERSAFVKLDELFKKYPKVSIIFDTPYARRLYWNPQFNFRTDKNPNAQGLWMHAYMNGEKKDFARKAFGVFLKQQAKGLIK